MADNKNLEKTVIYELSEMQGLTWFKQIIFVSSY